jgi:pilus assembly protein Flp/PilA
MLDMLQTGIQQVLARFGRDETGAAMVEYGLLVGLIALVVAAGATTLGADISSLFNNVATYLATIPAAG